MSVLIVKDEVGKLGYGTTSTIWLARDLNKDNYVTLKIFEHQSLQAAREIAFNTHFDEMADTEHIGGLYVRQALDTFKIPRQESFHHCLVYEPLGMSLGTLRSLCPSRRFTVDLFKATFHHVLLALDFLHTEAGVTHTDLQPNNILLGVEYTSILTDFEEEEQCNPSSRKMIEGYTIYTSRELRIPKNSGSPVLCDFGEARFGQPTYSGLIQRYPFRAPEVILDSKWDNKVDIWNLAMMGWHLFEPGFLVNGRDEKGEESYLHHLAEMVAILGPPPANFVTRSKHASNYFGINGEWRGSVQVPSISLESAEAKLQNNDKALFLQFMRKMLQWEPEQRDSARELLEDPWLTSEESKS